MAFTLLISHLRDVTNEPYGNVVRPANDDDPRKADQVHQDRVDRTVGQQVAASSNDDDDDEEEGDPWKRNNPQQGMW